MGEYELDATPALCNRKDLICSTKPNGKLCQARYTYMYVHVATLHAYIYM